MLLVFRGLQIESVQVVALQVHTVITLYNAVRIEHRHDFEDKQAAKEICLKIVVRQQKLQHPLKTEG